MLRGMSESLEALRASSTRLNQLTDHAGETVRKLEAFLNKVCSLGVEAYVKLDCERAAPDRPEELITYLVYQRVGDRFRIAVCWVLDDDPDAEKVTPWTDCAREQKLEAVKKLPELVVEIAKRTEKRIAEAEGAATVASEVLEALVGKEGD